MSVGSAHVLNVRHTAALCARRIGRTVGNLVVDVDAERTHVKKFLAQLAVGRQWVDVRLPCATQHVYENGTLQLCVGLT